MITYSLLDNLDELFYYVKMQNSPPLPMDHRTTPPVHMTPSPMDGATHQSGSPNHQLSPHSAPPHLPQNSHPHGVPISSEHQISSHQGNPQIRVSTPSQGDMNMSLNLPSVQSLSDQVMSPTGEVGKERCFVCPKCYKGFRSKQQLAQHHLVHSNERKHQCNYCDKAFKQLSHLQQHTRIHTGEKPYKCTMEGCERAFAQLSNLQHHLRNHETQVQKAANRPHKCAICHRGYSTDSALKNHTMKMHIHIKPLEPRPLATTTKPRQRRKKKPEIFDGPSMVPRLHCLPDSNGLGSFNPSNMGSPKDSGMSPSIDSHNHSLISMGHSMAMAQSRPAHSEAALNYSKDVVVPRPMSTGSLGELERSYSSSSQSQGHHHPSLDSRHTPGPDDRQTMSPLGNGHLMGHLPNRQLSQSSLVGDQAVTTAGYRPYLTSGQFTSHHLSNPISIPTNADLSAIANHMIRAAHQSGSIPPSLQFMPLGGH